MQNRKRCKIYTISPKSVLHQSSYCCVNIHVCYNNHVYLHSYHSCVYYYFNNFFFHLCSHQSLFPTTLFSSVSLSLTLVSSTWRRRWRPNHQPPPAPPPNHHQHHQPPPPQPTSTVENPNKKSTPNQSKPS